ncbi:hypothetical protein EDC01DRAFT_705679 [Geopyxis carbonaria]|nr:hypothetical protein EDC01DRAFT_705679 [Geopyxis carbonaria]
MSSNLDRSLDEILAARPRGGARRGNRGASSAAPSGGVRKRSQRVAAQKANVSVAPNAAKSSGKTPTGPKIQASKIIVSNLPYDVSEAMVKEYFSSVVGPIKHAVLTYGPDGRSRGVATVEFKKSEDAAIAAQKYNGVEVDKRPMKVELVVDPNAPASFADRVGQPNKIVTKSNRAEKPKPIAKPAAGRGARGSTRGRGRGGAGSGRGKPKTAEQLDQEMSDYFDGGSAKPAGSNSAPAPAPAAANGGDDVGMEDTTL